MPKKQKTKKTTKKSKDTNAPIKHSLMIILFAFLSFLAGYHLYNENQFTDIYAKLTGTHEKEKVIKEYNFVIDIPASGGNSINILLANALSEDDYIHYPSDLGSMGKKHECHEKSYKDKIYASGFISFGIHCELTKYKYYTMLREPKERILTLLSSLISQEVDLKSAGKIEIRRKLVQLLNDRELLELDNGMVRRIGGFGYSIPFGNLSTTHLDIAKAKLKKSFAGIGIYKDSGKYAIMLEDMLKDELNHSLVLSNENILDESILTKKELEFIEKSNALDKELYDFAQTLSADQYEQIPEELKNKFIDLYSTAPEDESEGLEAKE